MSNLDHPIDIEALKRLTSHTEYLSDHHDEMVKLVIELCDLNSGTHHLDGIERVARILEREFSCFSEPVERVSIEPLIDVDDQGNQVEFPLGPLLRIVKRPNVRPRALLCIHMDTVYGADHSFQKCKAMGDGKINGPGVADAKGGLVVMLHALRAFEASPIADRIGWEVLINPDEELGSPGSEHYLKQRAKEADIGLLFEPSLPDGSLVSARKGVGNFSFTVRGKSVHSGREFDQGRNAVVKCCEIMQAVHALNTSANITYNVGRLNGGAALNVVPGIAVGRINVRVDSVANMIRVEQQLRQLAQQFDSQEGFTVELFGRFSSPPKELTDSLRSLKSRIEQCGSALGREIAWKDTGGASDGNKFSAAGLANVDTLGPLGGNIHSSDEYLVTSSLEESAKLTSLILLSLAVEH